ncbi:MAG: hypothetical protein ACK53Y_19990, partial [bacterium]
KRYHSSSFHSPYLQSNIESTSLTTAELAPSKQLKTADPSRNNSPPSPFPIILDLSQIQQQNNLAP